MSQVPLRKNWGAWLRPLLMSAIAVVIVGCGGRGSTHVQKTPAGRELALARLQVSTPEAPMPLTQAGHPADWWFVFKFNAKAFPACPAGAGEPVCSFGGSPRVSHVGLQFAFASSDDSHLTKGAACVGQTAHDPVGATFQEIFQGNYYYVLWNDDFVGDPHIDGCNDEKGCEKPWGHSKGLLAWNKDGNGIVMQVSTPSWPGSGSQLEPRSSGNTLGCVTNDNNVEFSQHFFALRLSKDDVIKVLKALGNASVPTDPSNSRLVHNGGPADVQALVDSLGTKADKTVATVEMLSSGVELISKPAKLHVPPWAMVSALLSSAPLKVATWWMKPAIADTTKLTHIDCWADQLPSPGPVINAVTGHWKGTIFSLKGGPGGDDHNHAKIGITTANGSDYVIFGDLNQQGALSGSCDSAQNARGGMFFVMHDETLRQELAILMSDRTP